MTQLVQKRASLRLDGPYLIVAGGLTLCQRRRIRPAAQRIIDRPQPKRHSRVGATRKVRMTRAACGAKIFNVESRFIVEIVVSEPLGKPGMVTLKVVVTTVPSLLD